MLDKLVINFASRKGQGRDQDQDQEKTVLIILNLDLYLDLCLYPILKISTELKVNMSLKFHIYADFDGTISTDDVGDKVFEKYSDSTWRDVLHECDDGKIGSKGYFVRCCKISKMSE